jgi:hypothetical protein
MATSDIIPDAVRPPLTYAGDGGALAKLVRLNSEFSQILQVSQVFVRNQGTEYFISHGPEQTLYFPCDSPRSGEARYFWEDRGDGVFYGTFKPEEKAG